MSAQKASDPQLRLIKQMDIDAVMAIENRAYPFPWTAGIFRDCLYAGHECWLLEGQPGIIGYFVMSCAAGEGHLLNLCVAPEHQGHGQGRRLLRQVFKVAHWHRLQRLFLEVRPSNPQAIALYESEGFNEIGRRPNYYPAVKGREDGIVMAMELMDFNFSGTGTGSA
jgi:ribosomal-protein-alanine N-acetyltransferase